MTASLGEQQRPPGTASAQRLCPQCGLRSEALACPVDGEATLAWSPFAGLPWRIGDVLAGRFEVTGLLGRGGQSVVLAVRHTVSDQALALKLLRSHDDPNLIQRFRRESQALARLRHPAGVRVFDAGHLEDGTPYLAMEHLTGQTLEDELVERSATRPMDEAEAVRLGLAVLGCLAEAHAAGLVHRDVKPANLFVCRDGAEVTYKVLDFGVARQVGATTATSHAVGTPAYMSPEQCTGDHVDGRADLYAVAVVLYRCVAGRLPLPGGDGHLAMYAHVHQTPRDLSIAAPQLLSDQFTACVMRGLAKAPEDRFASAIDMAQALSARPSATSTHTAGDELPFIAVPHSSRFDRRWPRVIGAIAMAALLALAVMLGVKAQTAMPEGGSALAATPPSGAGDTARAASESAKALASGPPAAMPATAPEQLAAMPTVEAGRPPAATQTAPEVTATANLQATIARPPLASGKGRDKRSAGPAPARPKVLDPTTVLPQE